MSFDEKKDELKKLVGFDKLKENDVEDLTMTYGVVRGLMDEIDGTKTENDRILTQTGMDKKQFDTMAQIVNKLTALTDDATDYGGIQTMDRFAELLQPKPYTLPSLYSSTSVEESFRIRDRFNIHNENITKLFWTVYPGNVSQDYGKKLKTRCGSFQDFTVNLLAPDLGHHLSEDPIFFADPEHPVHKVIELNTLDLTGAGREYTDQGGRHYDLLCKSCLTYPDRNYGDRDETRACSCPDNDPAYIRGTGQVTWKFQTHVYRRPIIRAIEKTSIISNLQDVIVPNSQKRLKKPFEQLFEIQMLDQVEIGRYLTGFTRYARKLGINREISYAPFIGHILKTKGLLFQLNDLPTGYIDRIFAENFLIRDVIICLLREKLTEGLQENNRNRNEIDLFSKACISVLELDEFDNNTFDFQNTCNTINTQDHDWIQNAIGGVQTGLNHWSGRTPNLSDVVIENIIRIIQTVTFDRELIERKIKKMVITSIAHVIFITSSVTAGLDSQEIGYHIDYEENRIIIYDLSTGGNGASELIYKNLIAPDEKYVFTNKGKISKPRYFDEVFLEKFLPCEQGAAERCFYQNLRVLIKNNKKIEEKIIRLEQFATDNPVNFAELQRITIMNFFPTNSGLANEIGDENHREDLSVDEATRLQLSSQICIHGCPDCIMLGQMSGDIISEPFSISKYFLDLLFMHYTENFRVSNTFDKTEIENMLVKEKLVIISKDVSLANPDFSDLDLTINRFVGKKLGS